MVGAQTYVLSTPQTPPWRSHERSLRFFFRYSHRQINRHPLRCPRPCLMHPLSSVIESAVWYFAPFDTGISYPITSGGAVAVPTLVPSGDMSSSFPNTYCFDYNSTYDVFINSTVTQYMVTCLNLTQNIDTYIAAYCTRPPKNDDCPFDFCPNLEIAGISLTACLSSLLFSLSFFHLGPLVRIASECLRIFALLSLDPSCTDYVTGFCIGV